MHRRDFSWELVRDENNEVVEKRLPPRRFKLSYMVTAWTQRPEDEHRLLSAVLACVVRHEVIPAESLTAALREVGLPIYMTIALPPPPERSIGDIWSALGGELKPSLDLVVTTPVVVVDSPVVAPAVREQPRLHIRADEPGPRDRRGRRAAPASAAQAPEEPEPEPELRVAGTEDAPGRTFRIRHLKRR
jgi:hypothetical protein